MTGKLPPEITNAPRDIACHGTVNVSFRKGRSIKVIVIILVCLFAMGMLKKGFNAYLAQRDRTIKYLHEITGYYKEADIAAVVTNGVPIAVVFQAFGNPVFTHVPTNGVTQHYWAYDPLTGKKKGIYKDVFSGFTVIEEAGVVVRWDPIYSSGIF